MEAFTASPLLAVAVAIFGVFVVGTLILHGVKTFKGTPDVPKPEPTGDKWIKAFELKKKGINERAAAEILAAKHLATSGVNKAHGVFDGIKETLDDVTPDWLTTPRTLRGGALVLASAALAGIVYWIAPQQVGILVYKVCLLTLGGNAGYWIDRINFPDSRPHLFNDPNVRWKYEFRRAGIIVAAVIACGLGA